MPGRILFFFLLTGFFFHDLRGQDESNFRKDRPVIFDLSHQFLVGFSSGKRFDRVNHQISAHYLSTLTFNRYDLGLGVGFENENYFNLLPAYFHLSYNIWNERNLPTPFFNAGLAFNIEKDIDLSNSIPGILLSGGIKHSIRIGNKSFLQILLAYRYQETSTERLQPSFGSPSQPPNETLIKHRMHRINALIGIKF